MVIYLFSLFFAIFMTEVQDIVKEGEKIDSASPVWELQIHVRLYAFFLAHVADVKVIMKQKWSFLHYCDAYVTETSS